MFLIIAAESSRENRLASTRTRRAPNQATAKSTGISSTRVGETTIKQLPSVKSLRRLPVGSVNQIPMREHRQLSFSSINSNRLAYLAPTTLVKAKEVDLRARCNWVGVLEEPQPIPLKSKRLPWPNLKLIRTLQITLPTSLCDKHFRIKKSRSSITLLREGRRSSVIILRGKMTMQHQPSRDHSTKAIRAVWHRRVAQVLEESPRQA